MAKLPTAWASRSADGTFTAVSGSVFIETGFSLLTESGFDLLLEDVAYIPKELTYWDNLPTLQSTSWIANDGSSTVTAANASVQRTQQNATVRTLQDGTIRLLQENVITAKLPAAWHEV